MAKSKRPTIRELRAQQTVFVEKIRELTNPVFQNDDLRALWNAYLDMRDWYAPPTRKVLAMHRSLDAGFALIERATECGELDLVNTCLKCLPPGDEGKEALTVLRWRRYLAKISTSKMFNA
jgi:hypothetical protein